MLCYPPFDLGWLAWAAFVPWIFFLEECSPRKAFRWSYLLGLLFFGGTIWWVGEVTIPGVVLLVATLALFFAVWGWFANRVIASPPLCFEKRSRRAKQSPWRALLVLPSSWVALEYVRSHLLTGFGWNLLAHTQWNWIPVIQIAGVTGVWGVSFLVVMVNTALSVVVGRGSWGMGKKALPLALAGCCLLGSFLYGQARLRRFDSHSRLTIHNPSRFLRVALLQGNIPQREKWDESFQEAIWKRYETLVAEATGKRPDLIIWPETGVPGTLNDLEISGRLMEISRSAGAEMLVGAVTEDPVTGLPYNSAVLLGREGEERERYSKIHLVPFGEFIPLKPLFGWLKKFYPVADFAPGSRFTVFPTRPPVSVLVCFEDLFPKITRRFVREGAGWLLVITNDAWFGRSAASLQHLQASVFRAVEDRVWIGRAANNGWTGFVDPAGRRLPAPGQIPRFKPGVSVAEIPAAARGGSPYVRWGDWFPVLCLLLAVWGIMKNSDGNTQSA